MPSKKTNINYPGWELKFFDDSKNFRNYQLKLIKNYINGSIAEIGPGNGANLVSYLFKPKTIDLYEPSKKLYLGLRKKFKKQKKLKFINRKFSPIKNKYNSILYLDVLEHIKEDREELLKAFLSIKRGGFLIINVPAFPHLYSNFDKDVGHYKRYLQSDFKEIFKNINYDFCKMYYYDSVGYFLSLMSKIFIGNYKKNFEKKIRFWDSCIFISKILDKILLNKCGKSLLVIIKK